MFYNRKNSEWFRNRYSDEAFEEAFRSVTTVNLIDIELACGNRRDFFAVNVRRGVVCDTQESFFAARANLLHMRGFRISTRRITHPQK